MNNTTCKIKNGKETKNEANNEILRLETNTSGKAVKIILLSSESKKSSNKGLVRIPPTKEAL